MGQNLKLCVIFNGVGIMQVIMLKTITLVPNDQMFEFYLALVTVKSIFIVFISIFRTFLIVLIQFSAYTRFSLFISITIYQRFSILLLSKIRNGNIVIISSQW